MMKRSTRRQWTGALAVAAAAALVYASWSIDARTRASIQPEHTVGTAWSPSPEHPQPATTRSTSAGRRAQQGEYLQLITAARAAAALGHWAKAAEGYGRASELIPRSVEAALGEQHALVQLERFEESERTARRVLKLDPANYWGRLWLAWALFNRRQYREAATLYEELLDTYPSEVEPAIGLGYAQVHCGERSRAAATFGAVLARFPRDSRALAGAALTR